MSHTLHHEPAAVETEVACQHQEVCHLQGKIVEFPIGNHDPSHAGAIDKGDFLTQSCKRLEKIDQCLQR
jgi:hypothetical protein